jgi:hypothetical protein
MKHHADLLDADFWQTTRTRIAAGHVYDVFPYERDRRFKYRTPTFSDPRRSSFMSLSDPIVIASAVRTPIGGMLGDFANLSAWQLGGIAVKAAVERAGVNGEQVDEVLLGNCLMAGQGQAPARQAVLAAGLPQSAGAVTLSKMCGSGMRAMMFGHDMLAAGSADVVVAGGMESMTNAPHLTFARKGVRYGQTPSCTTTWPLTALKTPTNAAGPWAGLPRTASPSTASRASAGRFCDCLDRAQQEGQRGRLV